MRKFERENINNSKAFNENFKRRFKTLGFPVWSQRIEVMIKRIKAGMRVVELGCGDSALLPKIKEKFPSCEVCGLDFSEVVIQKARETNKGVAYLVGDFLKTPYADNYFDCVVGGEVLEHLENPRPFINEMIRICKPEGTLVLSTPDEIEAPRTADDPFHLRAFNKNDLKDLFKEFGETEVEKVEKGCGYGTSLVVHCSLNKIINHIIHTTFTGKGFDRNQLDRDPKWIKARIEIFQNYTLKSLLNQSNRKFKHWIAWSEREKDNPDVLRLETELRNLDYDFVFTFHGGLFSDEWSTKKHLSTLFDRFDKSLKEVSKKFFSDEKYIYFTPRFDSDDMYSKDAIKLIQDQAFEERKIVYFQDGYLFNLETRKVAEFKPTNFPHTYSILFPSKIFWDAKAHLEYSPNIPSHGYIPEFFKNRLRLSDKKYIMTIHGRNHGTTWESSYKSKILNEKESREVLRNFL